ncbi:hypothetical protein [Thermogemmatispora sp.]|uniref:hypothetical protein n=1 Tax=Thermogemmatispora sp. TaxID=1968838 RepID=UPI00257EC0C5|nr:hypothetical protein [Thermogemmatispora sp.]
MLKRFFRTRYGYSRWDGTQEIEGLDADDIMRALADDYLEQGDLQQALRRLMQDGMQRPDGRRNLGLRELLERLRAQRSQLLNRYNMASGVMDDLRQKLEEIKQLEREGIERRLREAQELAEAEQARQSEAGTPSQPGEDTAGSDALTPEQKRRMLETIAQRKKQYLESLPQDLPGQIKALSEYDFMEEAAREKFNELLESLRQQMMQQFFQGMRQSLQSMTPEDIARLREMIRELNRMLRERQQGLNPDFDSFMEKYGEYFPGVNTLDDLIEQMQQRMAAMQALLENLSPEQRQELENLMEQLISDDRIRVDLMELAQNLQALAPLDDYRMRFPFRGSEPAVQRGSAHDGPAATDGGPGGAAPAGATPGRPGGHR